MGISEFQYRQMLARSGKSHEASENPAERESGLHYEIIEYCRSKGWVCFHGSMAHRSHRTKGEPDCTIVTDRGSVLFFECKSKNGKLSIAQQNILAALRRNGASAYSIDNFQQFLELVKSQPKERSETHQHNPVATGQPMAGSERKESNRS